MPPPPPARANRLRSIIGRWGNSSFDVRFDGTVEGEPVFTAEITYVSVVTGTTQTLPVPAEFRAAAS